MNVSSTTAPKAISIPSYVFCRTGGCWIQCTASREPPGNHRGEQQQQQQAPSDTPVSPSFNRLRVATWNILIDCMIFSSARKATQAEHRFPEIVKEIVDLDADIIGLNEVTPTSLALLLENAEIRDSYYVTEVPPDQHPARAGDPLWKPRKDLVFGQRGALVAPHGCVILSKLPFLATAAVPKYNGGPRSVVIGTVEVNGVLISICSIHTISRQTPENKALREKQLEIAKQATSNELQKHLEIRGQQEGSKEAPAGALIMLGDMNLHYKSEDCNVLSLDMIDAWAETHFQTGGDQDPGYTFDAKTNGMVPQLIPFEKRRMRLDRIFISQGSPLHFLQPCQVWGTRSLSNVPGQEDGRIHLSDHFGLFVDLQTSSFAASAGLALMKRSPEVEEVHRKNMKVPLEPWRMLSRL